MAHWRTSHVWLGAACLCDDFQVDSSWGLNATSLALTCSPLDEDPQMGLLQYGSLGYTAWEEGNGLEKLINLGIDPNASTDL